MPSSVREVKAHEGSKATLPETGRKAALSRNRLYYNRLPYETIEDMRRDPIIALGLSGIKAPIVAASWRVEGESTEANELVEEVFTRLWDKATEDGMRAVEFGWQPFEIIWDRVDGRFVPTSLADLPQRTSKILVDAKGTYSGLRVSGPGDKSITMKPEKAFVFTPLPEYGDLYGQSRLEGVYVDWNNLSEVITLANRYIEFRADPPITGYAPNLKVKDSGGSEVDLKERHMESLALLKSGGVIVMPGDTDASGNRQYTAEYLTSQDRTSVFLSHIEHLERRVLRGLLIGDRVLMQGQGQSGAFSMVHQYTDTFLLMEEELLRAWLHALNTFVVAPMLRFNNLPEAYLESPGLVDVEKERIDELAKSILGGPPNIYTQRLVDVVSVLQGADVPTVDGAEKIADDLRGEVEEERKAGMEGLEKAAGDEEEKDEKPDEKTAEARRGLGGEEKFAGNLNASFDVDDPYWWIPGEGVVLGGDSGVHEDLVVERFGRGEGWLYQPAFDAGWLRLWAHREGSRNFLNCEGIPAPSSQKCIDVGMDFWRATGWRPTYIQAYLAPAGRYVREVAFRHLAIGDISKHLSTIIQEEWEALQAEENIDLGGPRYALTSYWWVPDRGLVRAVGGHEESARRILGISTDLEPWDAAFGSGWVRVEFTTAGVVALEADEMVSEQLARDIAFEVEKDRGVTISRAYVEDRRSGQRLMVYDFTKGAASGNINLADRVIPFEDLKAQLARRVKQRLQALSIDLVVGPDLLERLADALIEAILKVNVDAVSVRSS